MNFGLSVVAFMRWNRNAAQLVACYADLHAFAGSL